MSDLRQGPPEGPAVLVDSGRLVIATRGGAAICPFKQANHSPTSLERFRRDIQ
jgi:hypothetical protein